MTGATIEFDAPLVEFAKKIGVKLGAAVKLTSLDIYTRIVRRTPVKTGRARSGWQITVGSPSDFMPPKTDVGGEKASRKLTFQSAFQGGAVAAPESAGAIDGTQLVFIVNNLPYIERLEFGHSKQAPSGMVRLSMAEVAAEIELLLKGLSE